MSRKFGNIIATMENLEQEALLETAEVGVPAEETATEVVETGVELEAESEDVAADDGAIDAAEEGQDQLAELTEVAEDSLVGDGETVAEGEVGEEGEGLNEAETDLLVETHETIMKNLGMTITRPVFTAESFKDKVSRRQATLEALDNLKASASKLGTNIMAAVKAALDAIVGFIAKILANRSLMEKHLVNLEVKVKAAVDGKGKAETVQGGAAQLSIDGTANAGTALEVLKGAQTNLAIAKNIAETLYRAKGKSPEEMTRLSGEIFDGMTKLPENGKGRGVLGGGKAFSIGEGGEGKSLDVSVVDAGATAQAITAANKGEMLRILAEARRVLANLKEAEGIRSRLKDFVDYLRGLAGTAKTAVTSRVGSEESKFKGSVESMFVSIARTTRNVLSKFMTNTFMYSFKSVKAAADFVNASLKNLGTEVANDNVVDAAAA